MMVGLPESTALDEFKTAKNLAKLKPKDYENISSFSFKRNRARKEYEEGTYSPLSVNQAVERSKELCYFFCKEEN